MTRASKHSDAPWRNFYGRFKGKALRPAQEKALRDDLPGLSPGPVSWQQNPDRTPLDLTPFSEDIWLEIGFGAGEHMAHQARANPAVTIIGCEPYVNGVAVALGHIRRAALSNVRIHAGDARDLLDVLPVGTVAKAFLLYPDPWPKARHHRRRFVTPEHLRPLARVLAAGAELRLATDIPDYVRQALEEVPKAGFTWQATQASDWRAAWDDWPSTRYEQKALQEGRVPHYLTFIRDG